jgi:aminoglycoside 6'-N-acetyltransferase
VKAEADASGVHDSSHHTATSQSGRPPGLLPTYDDQDVVTLQTMGLDDLSRLRAWLSAPHVARWFLAGSSIEQELEDIRRSITGEQATEVLLVLDDGEPIGWCQWYLCTVDPEWARDIGAGPEDAGIDYAIGQETRVGRGTGTRLVAALVELVRSAYPDCAILADPDERNVASRRVLEKNGFALVRIASLPSEPTDEPMAVYRLPAPGP